MSSILIIMPKLKLGGAEKQFSYLKKGLVEHGHSVVTILDLENYTDESQKIYGINQLKENFFCKEVRVAKLIYLLNKRENFEFTIVYDVCGHYLIPILKAYGIKVIYSERNSGEHRHWIGRKIINMADIITANSIDAVEVMKKYIKTKLIKYIANGVEIPKENLKEINQNSIFKILVPARIHPIKNQEMVVDVLSSIKSIEVHFAGEVVDYDYFNKLQSKIKRLKVENRVYFHGFVDEIVNYYYNYDLILLPSLSEGTPNVILEGYARKRLCLMSDISMNKKIAVTLDNLFESNSVISLSQHINEFINIDKQKKKELIELQYNYVNEHYSIPKMVEAFINCMK